jgi:hypothetical protein
MHRNVDESDLPTPDQRRQAVARIMAAGILRLRARAALPAVAAELPAPRILPENPANPLELSGEAPLTVHRG